MTGILKVDQWKDSGDNALMTSDGAGNLTANVSIGGFSSTGIDDNGTATAITIDSSNNVGIGESSADTKLHVKKASSGSETAFTNSVITLENDTDCRLQFLSGNSNVGEIMFGDGDLNRQGRLSYDHSVDAMKFETINAERMRIGSSGNILIAKSSSSFGTAGVELNVGNAKYNQFTRSGGGIVDFNRLSNDGELLAFHQDSTKEGTISISGTTTSYNGFTGTHWSRLSDNSKPTILKGTILESLDEMMDWYQVQFDITKTDDEGNETTITKKESYELGDGESVGDVITYTYEDTDYQATIIQEGDVKHTKSKISDTVDAKNVYGVFMDWDNDDGTVNDMYVAQTGTFVVRITGSETVSKGDLIQSNGDGTGKVQADDLLRASTVAKVLSTTKIETYEDGSYIVPCSLHC
jgi:hypothetical protein